MLNIRIFFLLLFLTTHAMAEGMCGRSYKFKAFYPLAVDLRKLLCMSTTNQNEYLLYEKAKESPDKEIQWLAVTWNINHKNESKVSYDRFIDAIITECNASAQKNVAIIMPFRRQMYKQAIFFGRIDKTRKIEDFSNEDAKQESIARTKSSCGVDLGSQDINWQVLDR